MFGFVITPLIKAAAAGFVVIVVLGGVYTKGRVDQKAKCNAAALQSQIDVLNKNIANLRAAAEDEKVKARELESLVSEHEQKVRDYEEQLKDRPVCRVVPDDFPRRVR